MQSFSCDQDEFNYQQLTTQITKSGARSERAELIRFFVDNLRNKDGKPFPARLIAVKLGHLKELKDLYYLKSICLQSSNFGKTFWGSIKHK